MTHTFYFHGSLVQYWEVLFTEYKKITKSLGQPPFEFTLSTGQKINEYVPKDGDEIIIYFWDKEHKRELLVVEAELIPDEDKAKVHVFVHPQGNAFEEPVKSAMATWKEIRKSINNASKEQSGNVTNIYIGGDVKGGTIIAGNDNEVDS